MKKILFVSGSLGLGHITRDLAIADELRKLNPSLDIHCVAAHPASREWTRNFKTICKIISSETFDLLIGDETYEITVGFQRKRSLKTVPFVMIYDFIGLDAMTSNPYEKLGIYVWNRIWSKDFRSGKDPVPFDGAQTAAQLINSVK